MTIAITGATGHLGRLAIAALKARGAQPIALARDPSKADLGVETVILVGHNPDLSAYAGWLLGADETAIELEKGAAALIEFEGEIEKGTGRLGWLVTPGWFMGAVAPVGG